MVTLMDVRKVYAFWGRHPRIYSFVTFLTFLGKEKFLRHMAIRKLNLGQGAVVLDLACGAGKNFNFLEKAVGQNGQIIGFDYSEEMLGAARSWIIKRQWNNVELIQGDAAELKIKQKEINGAISVLGLSAIPECTKAIQRIYGVLKKGSSFAVCDAKPFPWFLGFLNPLIKLLYKKGAAWDWKKNIPEEMERIFGNIEIETFLAGVFYIAKSDK